MRKGVVSLRMCRPDGTAWTESQMVLSRLQTQIWQEVTVHMVYDLVKVGSADLEPVGKRVSTAAERLFLTSVATSVAHSLDITIDSCKIIGQTLARANVRRRVFHRWAGNQ